MRYKEDTSLTTISTEGLMISSMIDAMNGRDVATSENQGAFLQTEFDKGDIHINIKGEMVNYTRGNIPSLLKRLHIYI